MNKNNRTALIQYAYCSEKFPKSGLLQIYTNEHTTRSEPRGYFSILFLLCDLFQQFPLSDQSKAVVVNTELRISLSPFAFLTDDAINEKNLRTNRGFVATHNNAYSS